jgi:hypothetical protein
MSKEEEILDSLHEQGIINLMKHGMPEFVEISQEGNEMIVEYAYDRFPITRIKVIFDGEKYTKKE